MNSTNFLDNFVNKKLICSTCYANCSSGFSDLIKKNPLPFNNLRSSFKDCFCRDMLNVILGNSTVCGKQYVTSTDNCIKNLEGYPIPDVELHYESCTLTPIPDEFFVHYRIKLATNESLTEPYMPEEQKKNFDYRPFLFLFIFALLLAVLVRWKFNAVLMRPPPNINPTIPSNVVIPLNERSLYYYQEEFGDEQLPKYTKDASDFDYQPFNENISLQPLHSSSNTTTTIPPLPTFEESQFSTQRNVERGEISIETQQNVDSEITERNETSVSIPLTSYEQIANSDQP
ncbi:hypothetical protein HK099_007809 [Clydaea vesicula]|uniref:Uncharacterized protein n=1 Tax=Clydaea vesicula TaxID=447962 RepID=A0AAD5U0U3_9FUNG|nr:hypothetical protein HK099_007809 [Clydaea vesicula]